MAWFFLIAGILFFIYFITIAFFIAHGTNFFVIWLAVALICFAVSFILRRKKVLLARLPRWVRKMLVIMVAMGASVFILVEGCIMSQFWEKAPADLDYLIVLGAQMKDTGPSRVLQMRLDGAYVYLMENENTRVILSGGQGPDEKVSEAQGMYDYLVARGIAGNRLILEDQSTNTYQNLLLSSESLKKEKDAVGIVTNNFHLFRAKRIAQKIGYENIYGIAARSEPAMLLNNMTREFMGVVKDFLVGNL